MIQRLLRVAVLMSVFVASEAEAAKRTDRTPPTVVSTTPGNGATGVSTSTAPTATFSEAIQPSSVSYSFVNSANVAVPSTATYSSSTFTETITPTSPLAQGTTYTLTIRARDLAGNPMTSAATWSFTTAAPADSPPVAGLGVSPGSGTAPLTVTADGSGSTDDHGIVSYAFNWGDGTTTAAQAAATATHTYASAGTWTVTLIVTDTTSQTANATANVTVSSPTADNPPVAALTVSPTSGTTPLTVTADGSGSTDDHGIASYTFNWGDGTTTAAQTAATATHTYASAGTWTVTLTVTDTASQTANATATVSGTGAATATTIVSLTFDDGTTDQIQAAQLLENHGMRGTFYVNSGRIGFDSTFMTSSQLLQLQQAGHEIAGHTIDHADLTTLSSDDVAREVCDDRGALTDLGLTVKNFAYPFSATNNDVVRIVQSCGYNSARGVAGLKSLPYGCPNCVTAESIPPVDPFLIRTNSSVKSDTTLDILQSWVTQAENGQGGWVPFVFHHVCDGCATTSISLAQLTAFVQWLAQRPSTTTVRTIDGVIGGALQPVVAGPPLPTQPPNLVQNYSLEAASGTVPSCFQTGSSGTNSAAWTRTTDSHSGTYAQQVSITSYTSGDRKLVQKQDSSTCAPAVTGGHTYAASVWYKGSWSGSAYAAIVIFYRDSTGAWKYWQTGPRVGASGTWVQASFTTAPVPAGATAVSFGLALVGQGSLTTDDYSLLDNG